MLYLVVSLLCAFYLATSLFLSQYLHTRYIDKDYEYKKRLGDRRLGIGISFIHSIYIEPRYGYLAAKVVGICSFIVILSILALFFNVKESPTTTDFLSKLNFLWICLPTVSMILIADIVGRSATKLFLNATAAAMLLILVFASLGDVSFSTVMAWSIRWVGALVALGGMGYGAFRAYVSGRHKKYESKRGVSGSIHLSPALYFWFVWLVNVALGFILVWVIFSITH